MPRHKQAQPQYQGPGTLRIVDNHEELKLDVSNPKDMACVCAGCRRVRFSR